MYQGFWHIGFRHDVFSVASASPLPAAISTSEEDCFCDCVRHSLKVVCLTVPNSLRNHRIIDRTPFTADVKRGLLLRQLPELSGTLRSHIDIYIVLQLLTPVPYTRTPEHLLNSTSWAPVVFDSDGRRERQDLPLPVGGCSGAAHGHIPNPVELLIATGRLLGAKIVATINIDATPPRNSWPNVQNLLRDSRPKVPAYAGERKVNPFAFPEVIAAPTENGPSPVLVRLTPEALLMDSPVCREVGDFWGRDEVLAAPTRVPDNDTVEASWLIFLHRVFKSASDCGFSAVLSQLDPKSLGLEYCQSSSMYTSGSVDPFHRSHGAWKTRTLSL
ncbi:hypothetical protein DFH09DRAFT_1428159 [Mycena vulgaris]|nr:hypothetical protein DFH09DRAFT_1428159 [Mycena vulgaris]